MITLDPDLFSALLGIISAVLAAFVAVSRYTSNLKLKIQELSYENTLLRRDTGSAIRQLRHAHQVQGERIKDLENKMEADFNFQPRHPVVYDTDASWLRDSSREQK